MDGIKEPHFRKLVLTDVEIRNEVQRYFNPRYFYHSFGEGHSSVSRARSPLFMESARHWQEELAARFLEIATGVAADHSIMERHGFSRPANATAVSSLRREPSVDGPSANGIRPDKGGHIPDSI